MVHTQIQLGRSLVGFSPTGVTADDKVGAAVFIFADEPPICTKGGRCGVGGGVRGRIPPGEVRVFGSLFPWGRQIGIRAGGLIKIKIGASNQIEERPAGCPEFKVGVISGQEGTDFKFGVMDIICIIRHRDTKQLIGSTAVKPITDGIWFCAHDKIPIRIAISVIRTAILIILLNPNWVKM